MSTVLYLTESLAVWVRLVQGRAADVHVETINLETGTYRLCGWLDIGGVSGRKAKSSCVTLVLDSDQAQIEAYPLKKVGARYTQWSNTKALREQMIREFPESIVTSPSKSSCLDTLLVQPLQLTNNHRHWLSKVEQAGVVFSNLVSTPEALAMLFSYSTEPYIVVSNILGSCKHVYCRTGCALFVRCFEYVTPDTFRSDLHDTINHLHSSDLVKLPINVYFLGYSESDIQSVSQLDGVKVVNRFETRGKNDQTKASVAYGDQYHSVIEIAKTTSLHFAKPISGSRRCTSTQLKKYHEFGRRKRLRIGWVMLLLTCVSSAGASAVIVLENNRQSSEIARQSAALREIIVALEEEIFDVSSAGQAWSQALKSALNAKQTTSPGPGVLLAMLGTILSEHENVLLDELSWVSIDGAETDLTPESVTASLDQSGSKMSIPVDFDSPNNLLVRLIGRSVSRAGLRERKEAVDNLVSELQRQSDIDFVNVVQSPLRLSHDNHVLSGMTQESIFEVHFRIRSSTQLDT